MGKLIVLVTYIDPYLKPAQRQRGILELKKKSITVILKNILEVEAGQGTSKYNIVKV